jgi:glycosyltransferase involved in cell wall biosynthesis
MNILIVISDLGLGGAQKVAISLANGLAERHRVFLYDISPEVRKAEFIAEISGKVSLVKHESTFVEKLLLKSFYAILSLFPDSKRYEKKLTYREKKWFIKRFVTENKINIINTHLWWSDKFIVEIFGGSIPCPLVISTHGDHLLFSIADKIPKFLVSLRKVLNKATCILYLSDNYLDLIKRLQLSPLPKLVKVINGFKFEKPNDNTSLVVPKTKCIFLLASRATADKGWIEAIEAIILLHKNGFSDCNLLLAGDGEILCDLQGKYPPEKYPFITFLGFVANVLSYIQHSDIILLPTYHQEQLPTFIIEGLFMGKCVIATDIGEIRNMITHNNKLAGIILPLVNRKPLIEDLYNAMKELMNNKERREECAKISLLAYNKFSYDKFISQYENVFTELENKK